MKIKSIINGKINFYFIKMSYKYIKYLYNNIFIKR